MYVIPLLFIVLIAIGIFFGPLLAVILLVVGVIVFGGLKFFSPNVEPESAAPPPQAARPANAPSASRESQDGGLWGEHWPEESAEEEQRSAPERP